MRRPLVLVGPALLAMTLSVIVAAQRPVWQDEGATIWTSTLPWGDLVALVTESRDAVHATYYVLMRAFASVAGTDLLAWRAPSILAMGLACLAVTLIGRALGSARLGVLAGLAFALLPVVWEYGAEARSVALATAAAAWASYVLVRLMTTSVRPWWGWVLYTGLITVAGYLFVYAWLVALAHLLAVLLSPDLRRRLAVRVLAALATSLVLLAPLAALAFAQRDQVSWITTDTLLALRGMAAYALGERTPLMYALSVGLWAFVLWGTAAVARRSAPADPRRRLLVLAWAWAILPGLVLTVVSWWQPTFWDRYVTVSAPAVALLLGVSLDSLEAMGRPWLVAGVAGVVVVSVALLVTIDWSAGRDHWRDKRAVLAAHASVGDGVLPSPRSYEVVTRFEALPAGAVQVRPEGGRQEVDAWSPTPTVELDALPATVWLVPFACPRPEDTDRLEGLGYLLADEYPITYSDGRECPVQRWVQR